MRRVSKATPASAVASGQRALAAPPSALQRSAVRQPGGLCSKREFRSTRAALPSTVLKASGRASSDECTSHSRENSQAASDASDRIRLSRRTLQVSFTCNKCGARTERLVNPSAYRKGVVFVQCSSCESWHTLSDAAKLIDETRFKDNASGGEPEQD